MRAGPGRAWTEKSGQFRPLPYIHLFKSYFHKSEDRVRGPSSYSIQIIQKSTSCSELFRNLCETCDFFFLFKIFINYSIGCFFSGQMHSFMSLLFPRRFVEYIHLLGVIRDSFPWYISLQTARPNGKFPNAYNFIY